MILSEIICGITEVNNEMLMSNLWVRLAEEIQKCVGYEKKYVFEFKKQCYLVMGNL